VEALGLHPEKAFCPVGLSGIAPRGLLRKRLKSLIRRRLALALPA